MDIVASAVDEYLAKLSVPADPTLAEMERYGYSRGFPIVGPQVGRLIYILARALGARRVLELGSGFGYSAYWFALAVGEGGRVVLTEWSKENADRAREYFKLGGLFDRFESHVGDALETAPRLSGPFDIIFNDIDKESYPRVLDVVRPLLRVGGLFMSDNMLWSGAVLSKNPDALTKAILALTKQLYEAPDFFTTIAPIRDGVSVSLRTA